MAFRTWFEKIVSSRVTWLEFEIRSVIRKEKNFREEISKLSHDADAIVFGGGGFWELWPDDFWSGTTLDLDPDFLDRLKKPVFFNALGVDDGRGIGGNAEKNFAGFLDYLLNDSRYMVSVRNDGSRSVLERHFELPAGAVPELPDHGFFVPTLPPGGEAATTESYVAISLAQDMPNIRFRGGFNSHGLVREIVESINRVVAETNLGFAFVPHIYSDVALYGKVLESLGDKSRREKVTMLPLETAKTAGLRGVDAYRHASLTWTMRFHASAMSIGSNVPTIGLMSYPKVRAIFEHSAGFTGQGLEISSGGFAEQLVDTTLQLETVSYAEVGSEGASSSGFYRQLEDERNSVAELVRAWAVKNEIGARTLLTKA